MKSKTPKRDNHAVRSDSLKKEASLVMANIWSEVSDLLVLAVVVKTAKSNRAKGSDSVNSKYREL